MRRHSSAVAIGSPCLIFVRRLRKSCGHPVLNLNRTTESLNKEEKPTSRAGDIISTPTTSMHARWRWVLAAAAGAAAAGGAGGLDLKCGADHDCNMLPDMADPANLRHLKCVPGARRAPSPASPQSCSLLVVSGCARRCGACQLAAVQLAHAVIKKEAALQKRMSEEAGSALLEGFCEQGGWMCVSRGGG